MRLKQVVVTLVLTFLVQTSIAQTATNFNVLNCAGVNYNLFNELDAGKVVVIGWAMPCGSCVLPLKTTYNVVQSYQNSFPDRVVMLLADDYANTPCSSIDLWANSNGMTNTIRFSNEAIKMMDYGSTGMPKVVVVGGADHQVFYNANNEVDHVALQKAINDAISVITALNESDNTSAFLKIFPNPSQNKTTVSYSLPLSSNITISIFNDSGQEVSQIFSGFAEQGLNRIDVPTSQLRNGVYYLQLKHNKGSLVHKFSVVK
jgi:thiol-disulfide isomerase/thioredoxin